MARTKKSKDSDPKPEVTAEEPVEAVQDAVLVDSSDEMSNGEDVQASENQIDTSDLLAPTRGSDVRRSIWPLFLGGAVVAAAGFLAAQYFGEDQWPFPSGPSVKDELASVVDAQSAEIETLETKLSELAQAMSVLASVSVIDDLSARVSDIQQGAAEQSDRMALLARRLGDLENRPIPENGASSEAVAAYERELAAMRLMFEAELVRIEAAQENVDLIETDATERAKNAVKRAALARAQSALDSGAPFAEDLTVLKDAGVELPGDLMALSRDGVASLADLQREFPTAARVALNAAVRADVAAGRQSRLAGFLRTQLGARSLEPRQGNDPDAVLSRAEAALRAGDLSQSLRELDILPAAGAAQMAGWMDKARARQRAAAAVAALAETVNN
ncbi:MAG: hypothetical protein ACU0DI_01295 [Paracoccaceae bacterium]